MKGFVYTPILIGLGVVIVGVVAYLIIQSSFFPPGLSDLQKVGYLLDQKNDLNEFYYRDELNVQVSQGEANSSAVGVIEFFKKNEDYRLKIKLPESFALGLTSLDFYYLKNVSTSCYSINEKTVCVPSNKSFLNGIFPDKHTAKYTDYFSQLNKSSKSNKEIINYLNLQYVGSENNFGRSCRKFNVLLSPSFYSDYNLTKSDYVINFCLDDHLGFLHNAFVSGNSAAVFGKILNPEASSDVSSSFLMSVKLTDFRTTVTDEELKLPQSVN